MVGTESFIGQRIRWTAGDGGDHRLWLHEAKKAKKKKKKKGKCQAAGENCHSITDYSVSANNCQLGANHWRLAVDRPATGPDFPPAKKMVSNSEWRQPIQLANDLLSP